MTTELPVCVKCQKPVLHADNFELFEKMHWLCFHLEYEHEADPDDPCSDPSCPWWHIQVLRRELERLGHDPQKAIERAVKERWNGKGAI